MISEPFSEIYRTVQECCPVRNPLLDYSDILRDTSEIKERKKRWKRTFCNSFECANALTYLVDNNLENLLNNEEKLKLEESLFERRTEVKAKKEELNAQIKIVEEQMGKIVENVMNEMKKLSMECIKLEGEFTKKTSNIPNILETITKSNAESEYLGKKVTVDDIRNLQDTRKRLLSELEKLMDLESNLRKEIQELKLKWSNCHHRTQRLENEILLKKTETTHQAIQIDQHLNRRLSSISNINTSDYPSFDFQSNETGTNTESDKFREHIKNRKNRRDSVAKWIGRLSINNQECENLKPKLEEPGSSSNNIDDKDEEVQSELQVLNLLSIVKIDEEAKVNDEASPNNHYLNLKIDPSPLLSRFLDPKFKYQKEMEPIQNNENENWSNIFDDGAVDFKIKTKSHYDGTKSFEEVSLISETKFITEEDIALFNIFVGELKRNENIPISSIGRLICSTLK